MKHYIKIFTIMLAGLLLVCAACGTVDEPPTTMTVTEATTEPLLSFKEPEVTEDTTFAPIATSGTSTAATSRPTQPQRDTGTSAPTVSTTVSPSKTRPDIAMHRETKQDGLVLKVFTGYQHQFTGEPFTLTASITNNTGKDITYLAGESPSIQVNIPGKNGGAFVDMDAWGKLVLLSPHIEALKAGETFTETFRILPGKPLGSVRDDLSGLEIDWFPAGEYTGTASFVYFASTDAASDRKHLQVEFPIVLL